MPGEIPLSKPDISESEIAAVTGVLRSGRLTAGPSVDEFEYRLAEQCGCTSGVAVSSGTAALHLALLALGIGAGDEVIVSPFGFIATANAIRFTGATPIFADIDSLTMNLDADKLEAIITPKTRAIIASATLGNPVGLDRIAAVAARHEVTLIENGSEGFGASYKGRPVGSFGRLAVFSFYPNRVITTGEGGAIVTRDTHLAALVKSLRDHGRPAIHHTSSLGNGHHYERVGFSYRLSDVAAAMGVAQLNRFEEIIRMRRRVAALYFYRLMEMHELILPTIDPDAAMSWFNFTVRLDNEFQQVHRDRIISGLHRHEVGAANYFVPIHLQPCYRKTTGESTGSYPVTESIATRTIGLPFYNQLEATQIDLVANTLRIMLDREKIALESERKSQRSADPDAEPPPRG